MTSPSAPRVNLLLVGAGLANGLLAWHIRRSRRGVSVLALESSSRLSRNRTWSFHPGDVARPEDLEPLTAHSWSGHEVAFPKRRREFDSGYRSITPESFENGLKNALGNALMFDAGVTEVGPNHVMLADGRRFEADCVVDGRGARPTIRRGFQKFLGLRLSLKSPHGLTRPLLMDATVEQLDGFRFFYVLPLGPSELLIEDTRYSLTDVIGVREFESEIRAYAGRRGWSIAAELGREQGALPIPLERQPAGGGEVPRIGMAGGFFHPVTGYSLPDADRLARRLAALPEVSTRSYAREIENYRGERHGIQSFYLLLNRMMFLAADPAGRYKVFEHFYRLPEAVVARFYRGETTWLDRARILSGRPPVPVHRALRAALFAGAAP